MRGDTSRSSSPPRQPPVERCGPRSGCVGPGASENGGGGMNVKQAVADGDREGLELVSPAELLLKMSLRHHRQGNYKAGSCFDLISLHA